MSTSNPISDPVGAKKPDKSYAWWLDNINHKITAQVRHTLETYSKIRPEDVSSHIYAIREKAWSIRPYPCTGLGNFLVSSISRHPSYPVILSRLKDDGKLLDVGCYIGQDLRQLAIDGAPPHNLYGTDIVNHWNLGYEFFNDDKARFPASYIESDMLHPSAELKQLHGRMDAITIVHVLHQWDWDTQILACKELVKFSKPATLIVGYQGGTNDMAKRTLWNRENGQKEFTLHSAETFKRMWGQVGEQTETEWSTEVAVVPWSELGNRTEEVDYLGSDFALLRFVVERVG